MIDLKACREAFEKAHEAIYGGYPPESLPHGRWKVWQAACEWMNTRATECEAVAWIIEWDTGPDCGSRVVVNEPYTDKPLPRRYRKSPLYTHPSSDTAVDVETLKALAKTWRDHAEVFATANGPFIKKEQLAAWMCADELEAALAQRGEADNG